MNRDEIIALDAQHVWHPYTPMQRHLSEGPALVVAHAEGSRLYDVDGRSYLDGNSSWWAAPLGHRHPRLLRALSKQTESFCHVALAGITHEPIARLAAEMCQVAPAGLERVFFSDDGSTAVEVAVKMCLKYWHQNGRPERKRFISLSHAFHGETLGATALGGVEVFRRAYAGALLDCVHLPTDNEAQTLESLERLLSEASDEVAGCIVEPMLQGAGGMRITSPELLRSVRELTARHDVFLIADEVFTGYGRTGPMWACDHADVKPDLLCVAKGFTAGVLPMAATLATPRLFEGFLGADERALFYGHTYCGHALGAAVAREVLAIYRQEHVLERATAKAQRLRSGFEALSGLRAVRDVRSLGMVAALDLDLGGGAGYLKTTGRLVAEQARQRGVYLRPLGNVIYLAPPLNIEDADLEHLVEVVGAAVAAVARGEGRPA
jgi:adenosylmethionine-8-amino-7-oxononanoate aminotransferase